MVYDDILNLKILYFYIMMNKKRQKSYEIVLNVVKRIISDDNNIDLNIEKICPDFEERLINVIY